MLATHKVIPSLPSGYELGDEWAVVVPEATTNLIINPSFELEANALDGYTPGAPTALNVVPAGTTLNIPNGTTYRPGPVLFLYGTVDLNTSGVLDLSGTASIARTSVYKRYGSYGLEVVWGVTKEAALTTGTPYTFSAEVYAPTAATYIIRITDIATGYASEVKARFDGLGWGRLAVTLAGASTTGVHLLSIQRLDGGRFYTDGWQLEAKAYATTYTDGDIAGHGRGVAYQWTAGAHTSTSTRSALTSSGGKEVKLKDLGLILTAVMGLGLPPVVVSAMGGLQDGSLYDNTRFDNRSFSLGGWIQQTSYLRYTEMIGRLTEALRPRRAAWDEPLRLHVTPKGYNGPLLNGPLEVSASYTGGLEGQTNNEYGQPVIANFTAFLPYVQEGGNDAKTFASFDTVEADYILQRNTSGAWSSLNGGANGVVYALHTASDGRLYAGGSFTTIGGVAANGIAVYDPATAVWSAMGTGVEATGDIFAIIETADGDIVVGGDFENIGGVAANYVARWDGSTWAAIGSGVNNIVQALAISRDGGIFIGGAFTTANGVSHSRIVKYMPDGTWLALSTGVGSTVQALHYSRWGELYIGGFFTTAGGEPILRVARWDGTSFHPVGSGFYDGNVNALAVGLRGELYAGGNFTLNGAGDTMEGVAVLEGEEWQALGEGLTEANNILGTTVYTLAIQSDGSLLVGGSFATAGGITLPDYIAVWRNGTWLPLPINLPDDSSVYKIEVTRSGILNIAFSESGTAIIPYIATVTNRGTADSRPYKLKFSGPCRLIALMNHTTGEAIYFDYLTLLTGETATLDLTPGKLSFISSHLGNILNTILPGSSLANWRLTPGPNLVSVQALQYDTEPQPDTVMEWRTCYAALQHGAYLR